MRKCLQCRKVSDELDTRWDKIRLWFFRRFADDIIDLSQDKYTQGIGDGYKLGFEKSGEIEAERQQYLLDEIKELQSKNTNLISVDKKYIITIEKDLTTGAYKRLLIGKNEIPPEQLNGLKAEAGALLKMSLWTVFQETIKNQAYQTMFENSQTFDDMKSGKMMLHNLSVQKNIIDLLSKS